MEEKELLAQAYHKMYQGMIEKDMQLLEETLDDAFVLAHMTGMRQNKAAYISAIVNGTLNYYSEKTEGLQIAVDGETASLTGQSIVNAAVFGGGRHVWHLQLSMKAVRRQGTWYFTEAKASTY